MIATRSGEIADDSESEGESDEEMCEGESFWLCVVIQTCTSATTASKIKSTLVKPKEKYIIVRWLEKEPESSDCYTLSTKEDCISGHRVKGLLPVKKLGSIKNTESGIATYKLNQSNKHKIMVLAKRG